MNYLSCALSLSLREQRRRWQLWLLLALLLLGGCALHPLADRSAEDAVCVGVSAPEEGADRFCRRLQERSGGGLRFRFCDEETVRKRVASSQWDCGLVLAEDLDARLAAGDGREGITLLTGPGTTVAPLIREVVTAALSEEIAPALAGNYLLEQGVVSRVEDLSPALREPLPEESRVHVQAELLHGEGMRPLDLRGDSLRRSAEGTLAVLLLVWTLFAALDLGRWRERPIARRLAPLRSPLILLLPQLLAALLPIGAGAALALCVGLGLEGVRGALSLLPYLCSVGSCALFLSLCPLLLEILPALIPLLAAASFLGAPILMDMGQLLPQFDRVLHALPVTLYLESSGGNLWAALGLLLWAVCFLVLAALRACRLSER